MNTEAGNDSTRKNVLICDTQPVAVEGMKWLIENSGDLRFAGAVPTLEAVSRLLYPETARAAEELAEISAGSSDPGAAGHEAPLSRAEDAPVAEIPVLETSAPEIFSGEIFAMAAAAGTGRALEALSEPAPVCEPIDAVVIDKGLGFSGVMDLLHRLTSTSHPTPVVVWGAAISEVEALRMLQAGARGIVRRTSESGTLLACLRAVTSGGTWMEDGIFGSADKLFNPRRSQLTHRESEVVVLVEKGLRNRDIARLLGIQTGTVKIHLKHIFEKTGVRGRYGLAYTGLQNKGSIAAAQPQLTA